MPKVTDTVDVLRQGWNDAASSLAPDVAGLREALDEGVATAERAGALDEQTLLAAIDEAMRMTGDALAPEVGQALVRRLQRCVYEYLLSLDAALPQEGSAWAAHTAHPEGAVLIGAEEVAALRSGHPAPEAAAAEAPPAEPAPPPHPEVSPEPEVMPAPEVSAEAELSAPAAEVQPSPAEPPEPAASEPLPPEAGTPAEPAAPGEPGPRRFAIFGRSSRQSVGYRVRESRAAEPQEPAEPELPRPAEPYAIAPREGFHIVEDPVPIVVETPAPAPEREIYRPPTAPQPKPLPEPQFEVETPAASEAVAEAPQPQPAQPAMVEVTDDEKGWHVREEHPGSGPHLTAASQRAEQEAAAPISDAVMKVRQKIEERLARKRCDEAAALVQRLAQDTGGRAVAELALNAGDRCRALGKDNSALSCYLAATRADPVFDEPLLRLADICIGDQDIDLAVAYLERVARFYRLGGDHRGAVRILRRIATIAPYRDDILSTLVRVQSTGRFEE